jgi:hypothetical protein
MWYVCGILFTFSIVPIFCWKDIMKLNDSGFAYYLLGSGLLSLIWPIGLSAFIISLLRDKYKSSLHLKL